MSDPDPGLGPALDLPATCDVAFKEWEGVCAALARGRQALILRKGGIEEGPGGFTPEHRAFWLYPTRVHQAQQGLKPDALEGPAEADVPEGTVALGALAVVSWVGQVDRADQLPALDGLHVWTSETVKTRFHYRRPGLWVLGVRVFRRSEPWAVPVAPEHAGCKTWVPLGAGLPTSGLAAALAEAEFRDRMGRLRAALGRSPLSPGRDDP